MNRAPTRARLRSKIDGSGEEWEPSVGCEGVNMCPNAWEMDEGVCDGQGRGR